MASAQQVVAQLEDQETRGRIFSLPAGCVWKGPHVGEGIAEIGGEAVDDLGSPVGFLLAGKNDFSSVPIGFDDDRVGCKDGADACAAQMTLDLLQCGAVGVRQARKRRRRGETSLLAGATPCQATADFERRRRIQF